jgi:hypothetical protein
MLDALDQLPPALPASLRQRSAWCQLPWSTLMRWRQRRRAGVALIQSPGPRKTGVLDEPALLADLRPLHLGGQRCRGAGAVYRTHAHALSRRAFAAYCAAEQHRRRAQLTHLDWSTAMAAWAVDDTQLGHDPEGQPLWLNTLQDLGSSYKLPGLLGPLAPGAQIADHLERLFHAYGAPLILKRDNGSNLNHHDVNALLAAWGVIPLNSPAAYPQYNGAIEHAQREIKAQLGDLSPRPLTRWRRDLYAARQALNLRPRRRLLYNNALACFTGCKTPAIFAQEARRRAPEEIHHLQQTLLLATNHPTAQILASTRRNAITLWLEQQGLITIKRAHQCHPI